MLLWDALRIRKIASEPLKISASLRLLADLHFSKEENMHAALFYEECARHLKEHDMNDPHLPLVLIDLARTKYRLGEYAESMIFFEEALALYERTLDHDDDRIANLQYEMGVLAFQMGDREQGEACFRHFIRIRKMKGTNGENGHLDEGVANALFVLGSLHWATKKRDLAHDCWVEALDILPNFSCPTAVVGTCTKACTIFRKTSAFSKSCFFLGGCFSSLRGIFLCTGGIIIHVC